MRKRFPVREVRFSVTIPFIGDPPDLAQLLDLYRQHVDNMIGDIDCLPTGELHEEASDGAEMSASVELLAEDWE